MARKTLLLCYHAASGPCHWSILVPEAGSFTRGKIIHVVGSPYTGFGLEFKRNYNVRVTVIELAKVDDSNIVDVPRTGTKTTQDFTPHDALEREALRVDAPVASKTLRDPVFRDEISIK